MSRCLSLSAGSAAAGDGLHHLVVKRGHHGRYRFTLIKDGEKIGGEVRIDVFDLDRNDLRSLALTRISELAAALLVNVTTDPTGESGALGDNVKSSIHVGTPVPKVRRSARKGDRRGQI